MAFITYESTNKKLNPDHQLEDYRINYSSSFAITGTYTVVATCTCGASRYVEINSVFPEDLPACPKAKIHRIRVRAIGPALNTELFVHAADGPDANRQALKVLRNSNLTILRAFTTCDDKNVWGDLLAERTGQYIPFAESRLVDPDRQKS